MALTLHKVPDGFDVWGRTKVFAFDVTFDTNYPLTNGYVINASDVGLKTFHGIQVLGGNKAAGAVVAHADLSSVSTESFIATALALRLFLPAGGATAPATLTAPVSGASGAGVITNGAISIAASTATPASGAVAVLSTGAQPAIPVVFGAITQATSTVTGGAGGAITAGIGKEVGDTTDVSSITIRILFMGK